MTRKRKLNFFFTLTLLIICFTAGTVLFINQPKFGRYPQGERLERIQQSPNYNKDRFQNAIPTSQLTEDSNFIATVWEVFFTENAKKIPNTPLPTIKTDLAALDKTRNVVVWLGHSSYFIQMAGKRILIDPVLSDYASPFSFINRAFAGTNLYTVDDIPAIDYLLISHDHWDHLDYFTVTKLIDKVENVVVPLGVGEHLEYWGYPAEKLHEADWFSALTLDNELSIHVLPARHFSGRLFTRDKTLWASFALKTSGHSVYFGGDSGYGPHFKEINQALGGFDLVMLDSGQYDARWADIHMMPEQTVTAASDLQTKALMPMHIGKFSIANHAWDEPFIRISEASKNAPFALLTPMIGEPVWLDNQEQRFSRWWQAPQNG